jgi:hypothetical protein
MKYNIDWIITLKWRVRGKPVPPPHIIKEKMIKEYAKSGNIFIETGTYQGQMIDAVKGHFKKIYSIELDGVLFEKAKKKFSSNSSIEILKGDSGIILADILKKVNEPCVFWLDGHYSGGITSKGNLNTPICRELETIFNHKVKNHTIIIDDARCFVGKNDYPTIDAIKDLVATKTGNNMGCKIVNDAILIKKYDKA